MNNQIIHNPKSQLATISPITKKALESLLPAEQNIIKAALAPKINTLDPVDVELSIKNIFTEAYTIAGQQFDPATLVLYSGTFADKLAATFPGITLQEIRTAIGNGVYGEYGEYFGLNPKTFMQFIKAYLFSKERTEARKNFDATRLLLTYSVELSEIEKEESNKGFVNDLYADFLNGKLLVDFIPAFIYDFLAKLKLIALTKEEKAGYKAKAKEYYTRLTYSPKMKSSAKDELAGITLSSDSEQTIKNISKQFAVWDFFGKHKVNHETEIFINRQINYNESEN